jgi:hypothetical protein
MNKKLVGFVLALAILVSALGFSFAPASAATPAKATVTVIHGVPGLTVDVYVNGAKALPNFAPFTVTDPIKLPAGTYDIVIVPAGGDPANPAIAGSAKLMPGRNYSIIANLDANGAPTLSVFRNNLFKWEDGKARFFVRHLAEAPAVDINVYKGANADKFLKEVKDIANGANRNMSVKMPGTYSVTLEPAGTETVITPPVPVTLKPDVLTLVYAVGSLSGGSFTFLVQEVPAP